MALNNRLWLLSHRAYGRGWLKVGRLTELLYNIVCANSISTKTKIGGGTVFFHHGLGCVVHELSVIGEDCKIFGNVTIGCKWAGGTDIGLPPKVGNNVMIGAGAVLLGDIHIGDNSIIGANSVVLKDVPAGCMAVGAPARIISRK